MRYVRNKTKRRTPMNKILIILLLIWGAGCSQQEKKEMEFRAMTPIEKAEHTAMWNKKHKPSKQDTLRLIYTFVVGADHIMRQINPPKTPCLYSTEYEVCQMRGHDYGSWSVHFPSEVKCKWCWSAP
jgi:hypothetical protein